MPVLNDASRTPRLVLKPGREKSLLRGHPWIFSGALAGAEGSPEKGGGVLVCDAKGTPLAKASYSPESQIVARVWTFDPGENVDEAFFERRVAQALALRKSLGFEAPRDAFRLLNAESDGLPGVVVDIYGNAAVCQISSAGAERWKGVIANCVARALPSCESVYERGDLDARLREGLPQASGVLFGREAPEKVEIVENGIRFQVDVRKGHKTGFYLDQRANRLLVARAARGVDSALNCFCYTGGFGLAALKGGARKVLNVDISSDALAQARANAQANGFSEEAFETLEDDVFQRLRRLRDSRASFDLIVLDPPKFADSKGHVEKAARGYKDINLLGIKLLRPGGRLFTFSCSAAIDCELFQKIVASAAQDSGRKLKFISWLGQDSDHPVDSAFPEGRYLKGLACVAQ